VGSSTLSAASSFFRIRFPNNNFLSTQVPPYQFFHTGLQQPLQVRFCPEQTANPFQHGERLPKNSLLVSTLSSSRSFSTPVSKPILGIDFLSSHRLLVDPFSKAVLFALSLQPVGCTVAAASSRFAASISHIVPSVRSLLASFPSIVGDGKGTPRPRNGVRHFVETAGRPVFAKARRLDPDKLRIAEAEFRSLEAAGIVRRSNSPWSSPLHMVPKQDG
jgi:hypothetical protein